MRFGFQKFRRAQPEPWYVVRKGIDLCNNPLFPFSRHNVANSASKVLEGRDTSRPSRKYDERSPRAFALVGKRRRSQPRSHLKLEAHRQLRLPRIPYAYAQEPVEVEELWRRQRIHVVFVVEGVEHFDLWN